MDNASKALLMAGGILMAVLIIGLLGYMFTSMSGVFQSEEDIETIRDIEEYNKEYISYDRKLLRGADIYSLINKVIDRNEKYELDEYTVTIEFELKEDIAAYKKVKTGRKDARGLDIYETQVTQANSLKAGVHKISWKSDTAYQTLRNSSDEIKQITDDAFKDFKRRVFDCTSIEKNKMGRVCKLKFIERTINYNEGI